MKNRNIIAIPFALAFALAPVTEAQPIPQGGPAVAAAATHQPVPDGSTVSASVAIPVITIHSAGNILRGKTGSFVLATLATTLPPITASGASGRYVNFSVSGTAVAGVDYVPLLSPAFIAASGFGVISVKTLPDPRAGFSNRAYSVVVTLEPGAGYAVGEPKSAKLLISTNCVLQACW